MCDSTNPLAGGACPVKNTGPPPVTFPLIDAIKQPREIRSRTEGSWNAIGDNVKAIDYYIKTLGTGPQYQGYGRRAIYNTGIKCSNMPGYAHRIADGTAAGVGGYGLVPRMLGGVAGFLPTDLVSSAKDEVSCTRMRLHQNTPQETSAMKSRGTNAIPSSNRVKISGNSGVDYYLVDKLCKQGRLRPCEEHPVSDLDLNKNNEGFNTRRYLLQGEPTDNSMVILEKLAYFFMILGIITGITIIVIRKR